MPVSPRRLAVALGALALLGAMGKMAFTVQLSSVRDGFYRVQGQGFLLQMPDCLRPCAFCDATVQLADRRVLFEGGGCRFERVLRRMEPAHGLYDIWVTRFGRDFYGTRIGGWLIETRGCSVDAAETASRVVVDGRTDRILLSAPDHPDASITGRVTCPILRIYSEVLI